MNRQTNKFHCDLPHPHKSEMDKCRANWLRNIQELRSNCKPVEPDERAKQIEHDMLLAFVQIVDTHNRMIILTAKQSSPPATAHVVDSHASEEVGEQDLG